MKLEVHDLSHLPNTGWEGPTICEMNDDGSCHPLFILAGTNRSEAAMENALSLCAAAPDLLAACKAFLECPPKDRHDIALEEIVEAAIAKAEGQS